MRSIATSTTILLLALRLDAAAQGPFVNETSYEHASRESVVASADPITHPAMPSIPLAVRGQVFETWSAVEPSKEGAVTAPLHAPVQGSRPGLSGNGARSAGQIGAFLGAVAGAVMGRAVFEGQDLGCDKYGQCHGRVQSGEAVVVGTAVMAGAGFVLGTAIGMLKADDLSTSTPIQNVRLKVTPKGSPGVKFTTVISF
jgi:hypothetical protein